MLDVPERFFPVGEGIKFLSLVNYSIKKIGTFKIL